MIEPSLLYRRDSTNIWRIFAEYELLDILHWYYYKGLLSELGNQKLVKMARYPTFGHICKFPPHESQKSIEILVVLIYGVSSMDTLERK